MDREKYTSVLIRAIFQPSTAFKQLSVGDPSPLAVLFKYSLWLLLLPPIFSWIGSSVFGWRLGAVEPLVMSNQALTAISVGYFIALVFGFISTVIICRWMASTYGAKDSLGLHFALITIVAAPLCVASIAHMFPSVFINVLILIPAMIWSMYLLYTGIPVVLAISPGKGMLMASSLVGWLLVAAVSLLGLSMGLWTMGIGPFLGV